MDTKILAVPVNKLTKLYSRRKDYQDIDPELLARITHFFEHYKDLEDGKWVKAGLVWMLRKKKLLIQ